MLLNILLFCLGVQLCMMMLAACYGLIDFWYQIRTFYLQVLSKIIINASIIALIAWWLEGPHREAFISGLLFYVSFHILIFMLARLLIIIGTRNYK